MIVESTREEPALTSPVAAFDFDKTLTVRDCVVPFMVKVAGRRRFAAVLARNSAALSRAASRRDRDRVKVLMVREIFGGHSATTIREIGHEFASLVTSRWMREDVVDRLRFHQESGHRVVLVSASLDPYLDPLGEMLEVDAVLCTRLRTTDEGRLTGEIDGDNCRGGAKVAALQKWGGPLDEAACWLDYAYGDSRGDEPMLRLANHGINVSRTTLSRSC